MFGFQVMNEMENFQREMDQLFCGLGMNPRHGQRQSRGNFEVRDDGKVFTVEAILPGLDADKLDISIVGRRLNIRGEIAAADVPEEATWHRQERRLGHFEKSLLLSANVETDEIEAEYKQGILQIRLPKAASALPKKISVKATE